MQISKSIPKEPPGEAVLNWQELRRLGIQYLEKLGAKAWTDFNLHDPGITILEVLCYAITDLGYRSSFPIQDLLADPASDGAEENFFTAEQMLPCNPVTRNDFRKLIIDTFVDLEDELGIQGTIKEKCGAAGGEAPPPKRVIKNAWMSQGQTKEPNLFLANRYELTKEDVNEIKKMIRDLLYRKEIYDYAIFPELVDDIDGFEEKVNGLLYDAAQNGNGVTLGGELEKISEQIGKFINFLILESKSAEGEKKTAILTVKELSQFIDQRIREFLGHGFSAKELCRLENLIYKGSELTYRPPRLPHTRVSGPGGESDPFFSEIIKDEVEEDVEITSCPQQLAGLNRVQLELVEDINPLDLDAVNKIKGAVMRRLLEHRNLCEDFLEIDIVQVQNIGVCAEIEIEEEADKEEVQANAFYEMQEFLTPTINFYSLQEMLDKGRSCSEIFNGPLLRNGFLLEEELEKGALRRYVYESDLLQVIMDVPGVLAVRNLKIFNCRGEQLVADSVKGWCLEIAENHKPVIDLDCSEVKFKVGNIFTIPDEQVFKQKLSLLNKIRKKPLPGTGDYLPTPEGQYRDLDQYYSIQHLFPMTYGIGNTGVSHTAPPERKAQSKQLIGYLLLFDQLLADYLEQLKEVKNLLSVHQDIREATYFSRELFDPRLPPGEQLVPGIEKVMDPDVQKVTLENEYTRKVRRNQILDHLLARFGEKFTDYSILIFNATARSPTGYRAKGIEEVIREKAHFLRVMPEISRQRGKAFDYRAFSYPVMQPDAPQVWDTENVSGLKKRVCRYLGITDARRRRISAKPEFKVRLKPVVVSGSTQSYRVIMTNSLRETLLVSIKDFRSKREAQHLAREIYFQAMNADNLVFERDDTSYRSADQIPIADNIQEVRVVLKNHNDNSIAHGEPLNRSQAEQRKKQIVALAYPEAAEEEGFHLVEHILLRPLSHDAYHLLQPFRFAEDGVAVDPYSFWLTVVAPAWHERFEDRNQRYLFEQVVRRETPAHIAVRFLYLNSQDLYDFELCFKTWLEEKAKERPNERVLANQQNRLVDILNRFKDQYSERRVLGRTTMGCQDVLGQPLQRLD